jgi:membrane-bound serine protease (ClpP class)
MTALGFVLMLVGGVLVVAEAHMPSGVLGVMGGLVLIAGGVVVIVALGGGAAVAVPVGIVLGAAAGGWTLAATRTAAITRRVRVRAGTEALCGRVGVVRRWSEHAGQVFVDGGLWRARHDSVGTDGVALREGDPVVIERVTGLTLSVRPAEEWELIV